MNFFLPHSGSVQQPTCYGCKPQMFKVGAHKESGFLILVGALGVGTVIFVNLSRNSLLHFLPMFYCCLAVQWHDCLAVRLLLLDRLEYFAKLSALKKWTEQQENKMIHANNTLIVEELIQALEPVIRRIIREELKLVVEKQTDVFYLNPDMPIYNDMLDIKERNQKNKLTFMSHEEVWSD